MIAHSISICKNVQAYLLEGDQINDDWTNALSGI